MRLHRLEVEAFGPFAESTEVDFDALSEAGLFLLTGPTGAGKSSVLDAVCFALYGDVPGDRAAAKRLRSDHAPADVVPRVVLDVSLAGRRFRIDRSPAWTRPKKRGTGTTTEQARVVISERLLDDDGAEQWKPLSTRLDETGHLVTRLVGMTLPQFCQVAMLPQGRFQQFLRARSEDRHALLQQVFQTGRFDRTERWLRDRRVELRRAAETHQEALADLASRASEVADAAPPDDWSAEPEELRDWIGALADEAEAAAGAQAAVVEAAIRAESEASEASAAGIELAGRRATHAAARRVRAELDEQAETQVDRTRRLDRARRAAGVRPLHRLALAAADDVLDLERQRDDAHASLTALLDEDLDERQVAARARDTAHTLAELARVRPLQRQSVDLERALTKATRAHQETSDALTRLSVREAEVPAELAVLEPAVAAAREAGLLAERLDTDLGQLHARTRAARTAETVTIELRTAERALREATSTRLEAREVLVEIRERRLDGMAAEIAGKLAVGACCPVCGSADHPSPAVPAPGAPDDAAEREARRSVDDLEVVVEAHAQQVRGLETRLAGALAEAGDSVEHLLVAEDELRARLEQARTEARSLDALEERTAALHLEQEQLARTRADLTTRLADHDTDVAVATERLRALRRELSAVVPEGSDVDSQVAHHEQVELLAGRHTTLTAELARARATATSTQAAADALADRSGFDTSAEADAAWLDEEAIAELQQVVERHEREVARVDELLADADLLRAARAEAPDLEALAQAHHQARESAAAHRHADMTLRDRSRRLAGLRRELDAALGRWAPLRDELDLVADLAALVEGKHPDNHLQMRLSAYVLAHRLGQVVEAANLRLATMSDRRYSLVHTGHRGAGETRGGLSLQVRDDWTGESRDPATLSGGETFVVSLALALGLADVITEEAGGTDLDTLFVDEGFGSLDAETLEDVMDTLDMLRDGGRVVGVVSHVPEMQTRIPTQLRVHRQRTGSHTDLALA